MANTTKDSLEQIKESYLEACLLSEETPPEEVLNEIQAVLVDIYGEKVSEETLLRQAERRLLDSVVPKSLEDRKSYLYLWYAFTLHSIHRFRKAISKATTCEDVIHPIAMLEVDRYQLREIENEFENLEVRWKFYHHVYRSGLGRQRHTEVNQLYKEVKEKADKMWRENSGLLHTEMAQHWKDKYTHLSKERLRAILKPIAAKYGKVSAPGRPPKPKIKQEKGKASTKYDTTRLLKRTSYKRYSADEHNQEYLKSLIPKEE